MLSAMNVRLHLLHIFGTTERNLTPKTYLMMIKVRSRLDAELNENNSSKTD